MLNVQARTMSRIDVLWNPRSRNSLVATSISSVRRCATRIGFLIVVGMPAVCSELRLLTFRRVALAIDRASSRYWTPPLRRHTAGPPHTRGVRAERRAQVKYHDSGSKADRATPGRGEC